MTFYVKIQDQNEFRISLLESAREPLLLLKTEKQFEEIRERKIRIMKDLRTELSSLLVSIKKLDDLLPEKQLIEEMRQMREQEEKARRNEEEKIIRQLESQEKRKQQKRQEEQVRTIVREIGPDIPKFEQKLRIIPRRQPVMEELRFREIPKPALKQVVKEPIAEEPKTTSVSDMDRLEYTLSKIEQKLAQLKQ